MEKKVTGIDLDELKRAREEMMAEMGITPSSAGSSENKHSYEQLEDTVEQKPDDFSLTEQINNEEEPDELDSDAELLDMIDKFISNIEDTEDGLVSNPLEVENNENGLMRKSEPSEQSIAQSQLTSNEEEIKQPVQAPNYISKRNLSNYDVFAQYEINSPKVHAQVAQTLPEMDPSNQDEDDDLIIEEASENMFGSFDEESKIQQVDNSQVDDSQILDNIDEDEILDDLELDINQIDNETNKIQQKTSDEDLQEFSNEPKQLEKPAGTEEVMTLKDSNNQNEVINDSAIEKIISSQDIFPKVSNDEDVDINDSQDNDDTLDFDFFNLKENKEENLEDQTVSESEIDIANEIDDDDILNELKKQKQIGVENAAYVHISPQYEKMQNEPDLLPEIDPVSFVNVLSMQEFKNSDNFTFVLGRNENGNVLFETLKNCYNIAFFANENSYELLNTMLLSFMLKNSSNEFKLALCDGANSNNFNYYLDSKYLFGNTIAKNDDEIMQKLTAILAELEARYHTLAKFNVRSVEEYNILAKNTNTPKLSQILIVIDGYFELMHSSNFERIKNCLYQILRLGRIAGIYVIVVTNQKIDEDIINFNLPSRIGFKCSENDDSISMIGESGIDRLSNKNEFLYSNINQEAAQHIRQPMISDAIIKILIDNIEK